MKLASYKDGSRDGQLVVVSRDLSQAHYATDIASKLQQVLDDWNFLSPPLQDLYSDLNQGKARHAFPFEPARCMAPLPRAYQRVDGSAYLSHVQRVRQARGAALPDALRSEPMMHQGASDDFVGPCDDVLCTSEDDGIDFEAELAVITDDIAIGSVASQALEGVRLIMLANDVSLRNLMPRELAKGMGFVQSKPATAFSPVAVTPDELGEAWEKGRVHLPLLTSWNGQVVGRCEAGAEMHFHFGKLLAHLCKTRNVGAGSVVGSGAVSNEEASSGYSCIVEKRALEILKDGEAKTDYMKFGDTVRIEMKGADGVSVFGAIEQKIAKAP